MKKEKSIEDKGDKSVTENKQEGNVIKTSYKLKLATDEKQYAELREFFEEYGGAVLYVIGHLKKAYEEWERVE